MCCLIVFAKLDEAFSEPSHLHARLRTYGATGTQHHIIAKPSCAMLPGLVFGSTWELGGRGINFGVSWVAAIIASAARVLAWRFGTSSATIVSSSATAAASRSGTSSTGTPPYPAVPNTSVMELSDRTMATTPTSALLTGYHGVMTCLLCPANASSRGRY
jgi:hypothetical protein